MKHKIIPYILSVLFFASLGFGQFDIYIGFSLKPYMLVSLAILTYIIFSRRMHFKALSLFEYMFGLFLFLISISFIFSYYPDQSLRFTANVVIILMAYFTLRTFFTNFIDFERIKKSIATAGIVVGIANIGYYLIGLMNVNFSFSGNQTIDAGLLIDRGSPRLIGTASEDPNLTAVYLSIFFLFFLLQKGNLLGKIVLLTAIVLTFSRGAYISIAIALLIYFIFTHRQFIKKKLLQNVIGIFILIVGSLYIINTAFNLNVTDIATSRFEEISTDNGSGRTDLWQNAITTFQQSPLVGIGANASLSYNTEHYNNEHYVHNTYLEVLSELGIVGMFVYISSIFLALGAAYKLCKYNMNFPFLLLLGILTQMFFLSMMTSEIYMLGILLTFIYFNETQKFTHKKPAVRHKVAQT